MHFLVVLLGRGNRLSSQRGGRRASQTDGRDSDESSGRRRSERFSSSGEKVNYTDEFLCDDSGRKRRLGEEDFGLFEDKRGQAKRKAVPNEGNVRHFEDQEVGDADEGRKEIVNRVRRVSASGDAEEGKFPLIKILLLLS